MASRRFDPRPVARRVWREVGYAPPYARDLVQPMMETFDVAVILMPRLSIRLANEWLKERGRRPLQNYRDRRLRACLLARRGSGLIFLDGVMEDAERRYALAHEFAHYFFHYLERRRRAIARYGEKILPVLNGERLPTAAERLSGILQHVTLGPFDDFLVRDDGNKPSATVVEMENQADLIAMELLAPFDEVVRVARADRANSLQTKYGLPSWAAREWGRFIDDLAPRVDPVVLAIENALKKSL